MSAVVELPGPPEVLNLSDVQRIVRSTVVLTQNAAAAGLAVKRIHVAPGSSGCRLVVQYAPADVA